MVSTSPAGGQDGGEVSLCRRIQAPTSDCEAQGRTLQVNDLDVGVQGSPRHKLSAKDVGLVSDDGKGVRRPVERGRRRDSGPLCGERHIQVELRRN